MDAGPSGTEGARDHGLGLFGQVGEAEWALGVVSGGDLADDAVMHPVGENAGSPEEA